LHFGNISELGLQTKLEIESEYGDHLRTNIYDMEPKESLQPNLASVAGNNSDFKIKTEIKSEPLENGDEYYENLGGINLKSEAASVVAVKSEEDDEPIIDLGLLGTQRDLNLLYQNTSHVFAEKNKVGEKKLDQYIADFLEKEKQEQQMLNAIKQKQLDRDKRAERKKAELEKRLGTRLDQILKKVSDCKGEVFEVKHDRVEKCE